MELSELRKDINDIDSEIIKLFQKRMECSFGVAEYKIICLYFRLTEKKK